MIDMLRLQNSITKPKFRVLKLRDNSFVPIYKELDLIKVVLKKKNCDYSESDELNTKST